MNRRILLVAVLILVAAAVFALEMQDPGVSPGEADIPVTDSMSERVQEKQDRYPRAKELVQPTGFVNTENITVQQFIGGDVVLIDIWTYSCINCIRTLPYLTAWHRKYKDHGLQVIGVHTPEFDFEKKKRNVQAAVNRYNITYPVVLDNKYGTWAAYQNRYWPRKYLIGIDGFIRYDHIGEGAYRETEEKIQALLRERKQVLGLNTTVPTGYVTPNAETPSRGTTPEIYLGAERNARFLGNGEPGRSGVQSFALPDMLDRDMVYLSGSWDMHVDYATPISDDASLLLRFTAEDVHLVAGTGTGKRNISVTVDNEPVPPSVRGVDVHQSAGETFLTVEEERLYRVLDASSMAQGVLRLDVQPGTRLYTFTFG